MPVARPVRRAHMHAEAQRNALRELAAKMAGTAVGPGNPGKRPAAEAVDAPPAQVLRAEESPDEALTRAVFDAEMGRGKYDELSEMMKVKVRGMVAGAKAKELEANRRAYLEAQASALGGPPASAGASSSAPPPVAKEGEEARRARRARKVRKARRETVKSRTPTTTRRRPTY